MEEKAFKPKDFDFEYFYETGIECPTWAFSEGGDSYENWKYIIYLPYNTFNTLDNNVDIWQIKVITDGDENASRGKVYEGLIPSYKFAEELFINLNLDYLPHVRRKHNLDSLLNKKEN